ncbi:hypothetical protein VTP01DRAFT_3455 [Rhizomucor pusillus]|uniref:uncharacterized protein n=1 Tax=Rhizomucor pusillus TaxID=4840 RepID=UPI00374292F5
MDTIRRKTTELLQEALASGGGETNLNDIYALAELIENEIYKSHHQKVDADYKQSVRSHIFNLKDSNNTIRERVLSGEIEPSAFAVMTAKDMASPERRREDDRLRRNSIIDSMGFDDRHPRVRHPDNLDQDQND